LEESANNAVRHKFLFFVRHSGLEPESRISDGIGGFSDIMSMEFMERTVGRTTLFMHREFSTCPHYSLPSLDRRGWGRVKDYGEYED
jgi:hypothetical protein